MIRGTTASFKFKLPCNCSDIFFAEITFWQPGNEGTPEQPLPIIKTYNSCIPIGNELSVKLCQTETLRFSEERKAYVQLRASTKDGIVFGSKPTPITVYPVSQNTIIPGEDWPAPNDDGVVIFDGENI